MTKAKSNRATCLSGKSEFLSSPHHHNNLVSHENRYKVQPMQKSSKIFFFDFFTWFDRARRALQNCLFEKFSKSFSFSKIFKKISKKLKKTEFFLEEKRVSFCQRFRDFSLVWLWGRLESRLIRCSVNNCTRPYEISSTPVKYSWTLIDPKQSHLVKKSVVSHQKRFNSC